MTPEEELARANRARDVLENEAVIAAFEALEQDLLDKWKSSPARDAVGRESLWNYLQMAYKLREQLTKTMEAGKLAQVNIQHKQSTFARLRDALSSDN
jgi:hypothetical protein